MDSKIVTIDDDTIKEPENINNEQQPIALPVIVNTYLLPKCTEDILVIPNDTVAINTVKNDAVTINTVKNDTVAINTVKNDTVAIDTVKNDTVAINTVKNDTVEINTVLKTSDVQPNIDINNSHVLKQSEACITISSDDEDEVAAIIRSNGLLVNPVSANACREHNLPIISSYFSMAQLIPQPMAAVATDVVIISDDEKEKEPMNTNKEVSVDSPIQQLTSKSSPNVESTSKTKKDSNNLHKLDEPPSKSLKKY